MLAAFVAISISVALGDILAGTLSLPVPGPVLGLVGAAAIFTWRGEPESAMGRMFDTVIPYAPMLFVPAGAGLVANLDRIAGGWLPIACAVILGTAGALVATGLTAQFLLQHFQVRSGEHETASPA